MGTPAGAGAPPAWRRRGRRTPRSWWRPSATPSPPVAWPSAVAASAPSCGSSPPATARSPSCSTATARSEHHCPPGRGPGRAWRRMALTNAWLELWSKLLQAGEGGGQVASGRRWSPPRGLPERRRAAPQAARDAVLAGQPGGREVAVSLGQVLAESPAQPFLLHLTQRADELVGRSVELADAQAALERGSRGEEDSSPVVVVNGPPGIGTSAVAVQLAHWARPLFPDGQLAVDLGQPGGAVGPGDALSELLQALGARPREVPDDLLERARRYRSLLTDRRALVLVERAADAEQVRALLPGSPGCAMIVTTRTPLGGFEAAARCPPGPLPERDGVELLARTVGPRRVDDDPAAALAIVRWCGRHPLAIRVLGAWMRQQAGEALPPDRIARDLGDRGTRGTGDQQRVAASLEIAHRSLSSEAKRVL